MQKFQDMSKGEVKANFCFSRKGWVVSVSNFFRPHVCDVGVWVENDPRSNIHTFSNINDAIDFVDSNEASDA
jgi:hypothetical protein